MPTALGIVASAVGPQVAAPIPTSGLLFWYDADDVLSFTLSGANVTQWRDKSGNGRHLGNTTGNAARSTGTIKTGRGSVDFTGTQMLSVAAGTANQKPFSVFAVIKHAAAASYRAIIGCFGNSGLEWRISNAQMQSIVKQYVAEIGATSTAVTANTGVVLCITYSATGVLVAYMNGAQVYTTTNDQAFSASTAQTQVGDALGEPFTGSMGELIEYDHVVTTTERQQVENYLIPKWCTQLPGTVNFNGSTNNFVSFGNPAAYQIANDIDLAWIGSISNYASTQALYSKFNGSTGGRSWLLRWIANVGIDFFMSTTGTDQPTVQFPITPPAAGTILGFRITRVKTTGVTTFYQTSDQDIESAIWTQVGATKVLSANSAFFNPSGVNLGVGGHTSGSATSPTGRCLGAELRSVIGGTPVMRFTGQELTATDLSTFNPTINAGGATITRNATTPLTLTVEGTLA